MHSTEISAIVRYSELTAMLATAGQPTEQQLINILNAGFRVIINLGLHTDSSYALPDERATIVGHGGDYIHIPVEFSSPHLDQLKEFSAAMATSEGKKVFVHCRSNKRVPVFIALDRILRQHWHIDDALREMRALWIPDDIWSAFIEQALQKDSKL